MSMIAKGSWGALLIALAMTSAVSAQAQAPDPKGCTPQERSSQALNRDADKNAGVICPPDVDPAMKAPTPKTGDTSVIPPPGSPGGDPNCAAEDSAEARKRRKQKPRAEARGLFFAMRAAVRSRIAAAAGSR